MSFWHFSTIFERVFENIPVPLQAEFKKYNKMQPRHYLDFLQENMRAHWETPIMTNFGDAHSYTYHSLSTSIDRLHAQFKALGIKPGEKIALAGRNCANWGMAFFAITTYHAVVVSILPDFTGEDIEKLVEHSQAKLLLVGPVVKTKINPEHMTGLLGIVHMDTLEMYYAREKKTLEAYIKAASDYDSGHPEGAKLAELNYPVDNFDELAIINYTSGSTGSPKGVMLTNLSLSSNVEFAIHHIPHRHGDRVLSMLPIAHMFGLTFEFLYQVCDGTHVFFLTQAPTPSILMRAFAEVKPYMILTVPLVIEKIIRKSILPVIKKPHMRILWHTPGIRHLIRRLVNNKLMAAFGGELRHLIIGGAALNEEVEICLKEMGAPYCVGYGMTECGPLLAYSPWKEYVPRSCGKGIEYNECKIESSDPEHEAGELQVRGTCVMQGYYRNEEATKAAFTADGWMRTGDLGVIDKKGNIFLRGRSKNMILGASGQNIYPEELEDKLNSMRGVGESVVLEREGKLVALVYPSDDIVNLPVDEKKAVLQTALAEVNTVLPNYSKLTDFELRTEPFAKTPKQSIKRYLYK